MSLKSLFANTDKYRKNGRQYQGLKKKNKKKKRREKETKK